MRILIDIGHPGHVHYFKNAIHILREHGHEVKITARNKKVILDLLKSFNFDFYNRGKGSDSLLGKLFYMIIADFRLLKVALKFKPDIFLSFSTAYAAQVSSIMRKPHIALTDTEHEDKMLSVFTYPFTSAIITPESYLNDLGEKQIRFNNVIEGLYLHKDLFIPESLEQELGIQKDEKYVIIRFVSWNAHHDFGHSGLDLQTKRDLIELLKKEYKIFISSESGLPEEFQEFKINIAPEKMHSVLAHAHVFIGESATMSSESALLGTPAVYINSLPLMGYLKFEQEQGLVKHFKSSEGVIAYVENLIREKNLKENSQIRSERMQKGFINPTKFLVWFLENYPLSFKELKSDPNYQNNFA
ncbi:MAG: DUF354 domain-containing protein [Flavobacteriaceae bacterium]|nr:DUF354 domain-containing protein [Flavobacteriaceae bacterium]